MGGSRTVRSGWWPGPESRSDGSVVVHRRCDPDSLLGGAFSGVRRDLSCSSRGKTEDSLCRACVGPPRDDAKAHRTWDRGRRSSSSSSSSQPLHHSTTPPLHHSTTPPLHHSTTPPLRHSTTPPLHHSTTPPLHHFMSPALWRGRKSGLTQTETRMQTPGAPRGREGSGRKKQEGRHGEQALVQAKMREGDTKHARSTQRARAPVNRSQEAQDAAHTTPHTKRANR